MQLFTKQLLKLARRHHNTLRLPRRAVSSERFRGTICFSERHGFSRHVSNNRFPHLGLRLLVMHSRFTFLSDAQAKVLDDLHERRINE